MGAIFQGRAEALPAPIGQSPAPGAETAHTRLKTRPDEGGDSYVRVVARLNDRWRVIVCRDEMQWILQRRHDRQRQPRWEGNSYCQTRAALLRCIRERAGFCDLAALECVAALPDHIREPRLPALRQAPGLNDGNG